MVQWSTSFIESVGYWGIFVLMILETPIPIIQSEIVMTFSGFVAARGDLNIILVIVAGIVGSEVGHVALYLGARLFEEDRVNEWMEKYGGWLGFDLDDLERAQDFFRRHDQWAVLIGRLLPGLRSAVAIPAGIQKMNIWKFMVFNLAGTVFWVSVLTYLGSILGDNYDKVDQYSSYFTYGLLGALGAYVIFRVGVVTKDRLVSD